MPNLLRQFNPALKGTSTGTFTLSGLNLAGREATSHDLADQAEDLVRRLETLSDKINMNAHWKLVTIAAGHSDLCRLSCRPGHTPDQFLSNVEAALDILITLPHILISLVSPMDPSLVAGALHRPLSCQIFARQLCPCVAGPEAQPRAEFLQVHTVLVKFLHSWCCLQGAGLLQDRSSQPGEEVEIQGRHERQGCSAAWPRGPSTASRREPCF